MALGAVAKLLEPKTDSSRQPFILTTLTPPDDIEGLSMYLQYFPETLSSSKSPNYSAKEVAGGNLPLQSWTGGGAHTLSFEAVFTTDINLYARGSDPATLQDKWETLRSSALQRHNIDVRTALVLLRNMTQPAYAPDGSSGFTRAPRKVRLTIPNSRIGLVGGYLGDGSDPDSLVGVITGCDITYQAFFRTGNPRVATVSLGFTQIPQIGGRVRFPEEVPGFYDEDVVYGSRFSVSNGGFSSEKDRAILNPTIGVFPYVVGARRR